MPTELELKRNADFRALALSRRGTTYEQNYGNEKAKELRARQSERTVFNELNPTRKGKTYEEMYGKEKADAYKAKVGAGARGRTPTNKLSLDPQQVIQTYHNLKSVTKTAKAFGCSTDPICRILKEHSVPRSYTCFCGPKKQLDEEQVIRCCIVALSGLWKIS